MNELQVRMGSAAQFAVLRDYLASVGYTERGICERMSLERIQDFKTLAQGRTESREVRDTLDAMIRLLLDGARVVVEGVHQLVPPAVLEVLLELGLLGRHREEPPTYAASVKLYPIANLYIASDLDGAAPGLESHEELHRADYVVSAISRPTSDFLRYLPTSPCDRFLELCSGTGIAALAAARSAGHAWAVDITERSTQYADFNARLNSIENVTALQGNLYEPVAGLMFDRIAAHPPYMQQSGAKVFFRDGGEDGEEVLREIITGIPDHLSPGGRFYGTAMAWDRVEAPIEQRIRALLGQRESQFDVLVVTHYELDPTELGLRLAALGGLTSSAAEERHSLHDRASAENLVYFAMILNRHETARLPITLRRREAPTGTLNDAECLLRWASIAAEPDFHERLLDVAPILSPHARLHVTHQPGPGGWQFSTCRIELAHPFQAGMDVSYNAAMLLTLCDGKLTVRDQLRRLRETGGVTEEIADATYTTFIAEMVTEGVLQVELQCATATALSRGACSLK